MEESILKGTKRTLGLTDDYTVFDQDIIMHINTVFSTLTQLGVGPPEGYMIESDQDLWDDFISDDPTYNSIRSYMYLRVRMLFDPPPTSYAIDAIERQIKELEWRLNQNREETDWIDPNPVIIVDPTVLI